MPLRILIADDHEITRAGVRMLIGPQTDWHICGEAIDGEDALAKVGQLVPDVVILDLSMPGMNGYEALLQIRRTAPSAKIVLFTMHDVPVSAKEVGADAFVSKSSLAQDLVTAIERLVSQPRVAPRGAAA